MSYCSFKSMWVFCHFYSRNRCLYGIAMVCVFQLWMYSKSKVSFLLQCKIRMLGAWNSKSAHLVTFSLYVCVYYSSVLLSTVNLPGKETFTFPCSTGSTSTTLPNFRAGSCCVRTIAPMKLSSSRCELFHCITLFFDRCEQTKPLRAKHNCVEKRYLFL